MKRFKLHRPFVSQFVCVLAAVIAILAISPAKAQGAPRWQTRRQVNQQIKSMPITQRPDRPGHIYGNTVRRVYRFTDGRVNLDDLRPM